MSSRTSSTSRWSPRYSVGREQGLGRALPALAICRGLQVLNVACGGTLRQHVAGGPVEHLDALHDVTIARGSRTLQLAGADTITVSSYPPPGD